jgi:hypothetical protein
MNPSAILTAAWKAYRLARPAIYAAGDTAAHRSFLRPLFGKMLRKAWADAKAAAARDVHAATVAAFVDAQRRSHEAVAKAMSPSERSAAITRARDDLALLDYAPLGVRTSHRRAELTTTLSVLTAA